ncbi:phosphoinositide-specific phospholipase C [Tieghemostelium lacteum]|uniref:Phosphoinositide phospholipase C n=1 Tax=Tieghemostelium lacteum TaxID=361077 RepID=A0A152A8P3_TIELA|nr:phosphoinositide-specific phospholipase C [Tieghemostelium lacteum]|eukprot:KYR02620.1 phosphoinositide-specific phospholipase C [Tieghemostelium lacteum]
MATTNITNADIFEEASGLFDSKSLKKKLLLVSDDGYDYTNVTSNKSVQKYKDGVLITKITTKGKAQKKKLIFDFDKNLLVCGKKRKVLFSEIDEIRLGHKSDLFNTYKLKTKEISDSSALSFSLLFSGRNQKSLDFICSSIAERRELVSSLYYIINDSKDNDTEFSFVKNEWNSINKTKDTVNFSTLKKLLEKLNYSTSNTLLENLMKTNDTNDDDVIDFTEFSNLIKSLRRRPEIQKLIQKYIKEGQKMYIPQMIEFFEKEQHEKWTEHHCSLLINKYHHEELDYISIENLESYLVSDANQVSLAVHKKVSQPLNRPITHYYCYSSHNTYLSGHQLKGSSSAEQYTAAFRAGCKCVELDVWDGSDGDPIIFHGGTLTSQIKFSHVLEAIKLHAFSRSPYPVILSLEIHCSVGQQNVMAKHLREILGSLIVPAVLGEIENLHSLEELSNKILLKGHVKRRVGENKTIEKEMEELEIETKKQAQLNNSSSHNLGHSSNVTPIAETLSNSANVGNGGEKKKKPEKEKISEDLSQLIYIVCQSYKNPSTSKALPPYMIHSFSEAKTGTSSFQNEASEVIEINQKHLTRVYPKGTRFNSSNFNPIPGWLLGCQLVALNHQTSSEPMWLNEGLFEDNGSCGYVLKPACLLPETSNGFDPFKNQRHPASKYSKLIINVLSARQLPKYTKTTKGEIIDPFVTLSIHGCPSDSKKEKTKTINNNGFNPHWDEEFEFNLVNSQLALLLIRVDDADSLGRHNRIGHYCLRVENIKPGYRVIKLKNDFGDVIPMANLFCKFTLIK